MGWLKPQEIYKGNFLPIPKNILMFCNLIPRLGQFLFDRKFSFRFRKEMALIENNCEAKDIKVTIKIK